MYKKRYVKKRKGNFLLLSTSYINIYRSARVFVVDGAKTTKKNDEIFFPCSIYFENKYKFRNTFYEA